MIFNLMNKIRYLKFFLILLVVSNTAFSPLFASLGRTYGKSKGFALVELYTSEGCKACPKAEKYLNEYLNIARQSNVEIICLSFHVNYWDYLGWVDKNALPEFTNRQINYGRHFDSKGVFTPQVIINGQEAYVGTLRKKIKKSIGRYLGRKNKSKLSFTVTKESDRIVIDYKLSKLYDGSRLYMAIVKERESVEVTSGENKGKLLNHRNVVKKMVDIKPNKMGKFILSTKWLPKTGGYALIGFYQSLDSHEIFAANQMSISLLEKSIYLDIEEDDSEDSGDNTISNVSASIIGL
jgi:hypothetical protein